MSVKKEASGRRSIQMEVEVPGTPEQVWQAIATGPGVSSWFVPTRIEEREGGTIRCSFGPGPEMEGVSTVTAWEPPHRFAAESQDLGPDAPPIATEWTVEARSGDHCVVRLVQSLFASSDDWDNQLDGQETGWAAWFRILQMYLTHFPGQPGVSFRLAAFVPASETSEAAAWETLIGPLGLAEAGAGRRWSTRGGATPLAGSIERLDDARHMADLRLDEPAPGLAFLFSHSMGERIYVAMTFFLYGDGAAAAAERFEPLWQAWMQERFRAVQEASC